MTTPFGKFELLSPIASSGMAEVFLARQRAGRFERLLVIKRILPHLCRDPRFVELFLEEARIAALFEHPNIVPIYDLGRVDDSYFIAMPLVVGATLDTILAKNGGPLAPELVCEIGKQALDGLHYAHERRDRAGNSLGLVHRDVCPANLMVNELGFVVLLDFGIATVTSTIAEAQRLGKPAFMSPEQSRSEPVDQRSDLFSLGVVLYLLASGSSPFARQSALASLRALNEELIPQLSSSVPLPLARVVRQAMQRDPAARFATAAEMHNALETAADELTLIKGRRMLVHCLRALELPEPITFAGDSPGALDARDPSQRDSVGPSSSDDPAASAQLSSHTTSSRRGLVGAALLAVFFLGFAGFMFWKNQRSMEPLRIGMAPHLPAKVLLRDFEPLRKYLQEQMNRPIELVVTKTYGELIEQLALGNVDVAELSGYPYLLLRQRDPNAWPLVAVLSNQASSYESYIVVRRAADKGASSRRIGWAHLRGKRICYVDRTSTSGYLMPRAMLRRAGFAPDRHFSSIRFSGNHYNALRDLINDRCDVAAVNNEAYLSAARHGIRSSSVRVIAISPPLPYGVYCASSKLAKRVGRRLKKALLALDMKRDIGRSRLSPTVPVSGFAPFDLREFNQLAREARLPR